MYFTHSTAREVIAFDYSPTGALSNQRVFYKHPGGGGDPDGFRVDVEGNIWHAVYGESRVLKISPQGKLVGEVRMPTKNITCVEFVGTELFITTAGDPEGQGGEESKELGGALFRVDVGVRGVEPFKFKLPA
jgi:sugar lactone lactonase YvrE